MNTKRGTKRIFYDSIVCITRLGRKFTEVAVVHVHMLFLLLFKNSDILNIIPGL